MNAQNRWERRQGRRENKKRQRRNRQKRYRVCVRWNWPDPRSPYENHRVITGFDDETFAFVYAGEYQNGPYSKVYVLDAETNQTWDVVTDIDRDRAERARQRAAYIGGVGYVPYHRKVKRKQEARVNWAKEGF